MQHAIRVEEGEAIVRIVLSRPPLNILDIATLQELCDAIDGVAGRPGVRVVVFSAEGKVFSAGVDVDDHVGDRLRPMIAAFHGVFRRLVDLEPVTVAAVHGAALGGGCELATFCDLVIASDTATFGQPEIQLAVFPPVAAAAFPYFVHGKKSLELLLTGDVVSAEEAAQIGLVNRVVPSDGFDAAVDNWVERLASSSAVALRLTKKAYYAGVDVPFGEALDRAERVYLDELMKSHDANEGLSAFREKREPVWRDE